MRNGKSEKDRSRRRRKRVTIVIVYVAIAVGLAWFFESQATTTVIFVRHAEKDLSIPDDPPLSAAGRERVAELTRQLVEADVVAGIDEVGAYAAADGACAEHRDLSLHSFLSVVGARGALPLSSRGGGC